MDIALITVFLLTVLQASAQLLNTVSVKVFYETLCPDSRNFIVEDLNNSYNKFSSSLDVEFIPFGKAHNTPSGFSCQHGPKECYGNTIDNCVLVRLPKGDAQMSYVTCRMSAYSADNFQVQTCVENAGLSWSDILSCSKLAEGQNLMNAAGQKTRDKTPGPKYVPTVIFNDNYNDEYQTEIERRNFSGVLCTHFQLC